MKCDHCNQETPGNSRFCMECGMPVTSCSENEALSPEEDIYKKTNPIKVVCPRCEKTIPPRSFCCPACKFPIEKVKFNRCVKKDRKGFWKSVLFCISPYGRTPNNLIQTVENRSNRLLIYSYFILNLIVCFQGMIYLQIYNPLVIISMALLSALSGFITPYVFVKFTKLEKQYPSAYRVSLFVEIVTQLCVSLLFLVIAIMIVSLGYEPDEFLPSGLAVAIQIAFKTESLSSIFQIKRSTVFILNLVLATIYLIVFLALFLLGA